MKLRQQAWHTKLSTVRVCIVWANNMFEHAVYTHTQHRHKPFRKEKHMFRSILLCNGWLCMCCKLSSVTWRTGRPAIILSAFSSISFGPSDSISLDFFFCLLWHCVDRHLKALHSIIVVWSIEISWCRHDCELKRLLSKWRRAIRTLRNIRKKLPFCKKHRRMSLYSA